MTNDKKKVQIYPTTFLQNDYVTKIYSCVWSNNQNQNDGEYLKLYIPKYLLKNGKAEE